jgi:hypothetical protein
MTTSPKPADYKTRKEYRWTKKAAEKEQRAAIRPFAYLVILTVLVLATLAPSASAELRSGSSNGSPPPPSLSGVSAPAIRTVSATYDTAGSLTISLSLYSPPSGEIFSVSVTSGGPPCFGGTTFSAVLNHTYDGGLPDTGRLSIEGYTGSLEAAGTLNSPETETWVFASGALAGRPYECLGEGRLFIEGELHCQPSISECNNLSKQYIQATTPSVYFTGFPQTAQPPIVPPEPVSPPLPKPTSLHCSTVRAHYDRFVQINEERSNCHAIRVLLAQWSHSYRRRFQGWRFQIIGRGHGAVLYRWRAAKGHQVVRFAEEPPY